MKLKAIIFFTVIAAIFYQCIYLATPSKKTVSGDFLNIAAREIGPDFRTEIEQLRSGEGDSDNVDMHVIFRIVALKDTAVKFAWLPNEHYKIGQTSNRLEARILYQRYNKPGWELSKYTIQKYSQNSR